MTSKPIISVQDMIKQLLKSSYLCCLVFLLASNSSAQTARDDAEKFEDDDFKIIVGSRTPEQLSAFYTGRGFNQASIDEIAKKCFVFGIVDNKTYDRLWLALEDWKFFSADGSPVRRMKRSDWADIWKKTGLSQAHQSTFGWTQLPESRDLRQYEHVGGNVAVEWKEKPFKLVATFKTGINKSGTPRTITIENLTCTVKQFPLSRPYSSCYQARCLLRI